jgi:erythronate-4-phosphate dehydrogenase
LDSCFLATPHIAGYSVDGKAKGTAMIIHELSKHFNLGIDSWEAENIPDPENPLVEINCLDISHEEVLKRAILATYDAMNDDRRLRDDPAGFEKQRGSYPPRREFKAYTLNLINGDNDLKRKCRKIGFKVI